MRAMPEHCYQALLSHCTEHMHGRTDGLTKNYYSPREHVLTFVNAREKIRENV